MFGSAKRPLFLLLTIICVWGVILACKSGDDDDTAPSQTSSGTSATATGSSSGAPTATGDDDGQLADIPLAGPGLSASSLVDESGLADALGEPLAAIEDRGTFPSQSDCITSQVLALTATSDTLFTITLTSTDSETTAADLYTSRTYAGQGVTPSPLTGAGDQASYIAGRATVLKGAQILQVESEPGRTAQARLDDYKIQTGGISPEYEEIYNRAQTVAPALASTLTGEACNGPALRVPDYAIDPCFAPPSGFDDALEVSGTTATPVLSDNPNFFECIYRVPGYEEIYVYSATEESLQALIYPRTTVDLFAEERDAAIDPNRDQGYEAFADGRFQMVGSINPNRGHDTMIYLDTTAPAARNVTDGVQQVLFNASTTWNKSLMRFEESSSGKIIQALGCEAGARWLIENWISSDPDHAQVRSGVDYENALKKVRDWCRAVTDADD